MNKKLVEAKGLEAKGSKSVEIPITSGLEKNLHVKNQLTWKRIPKGGIKKTTKGKQGSFRQTKMRKTKVAYSINGAKKHCDVGYIVVEEDERILAGVGED